MLIADLGSADSVSGLIDNDPLQRQATRELDVAEVPIVASAQLSSLLGAPKRRVVAAEHPGCRR